MAATSAIECVPDAPDHAGLLRHDDELAGVGQSTGFVSQAPIAERVVTTVAALLEEAPLHPGHPLGVEIALELGRDAQLPEHQSPRCPVERRVRQVRDEQGHVLAVELVAQVEHESGVASKARQVIDGDRCHVSAGHRRQQGLVAVTRGAEARLMPARV